MFVPKRGGTLPVFMYYGSLLDSIHVLLNEFIPCIGTFSTQKLLTLHCAEVEGGMVQGPAARSGDPS